jgi:hypothetical protein
MIEKGRFAWALRKVDPSKGHVSAERSRGNRSKCGVKSGRFAGFIVVSMCFRCQEDDGRPGSHFGQNTAVSRVQSHMGFPIMANPSQPASRKKKRKREATARRVDDIESKPHGRHVIAFCSCSFLD